MAEKLNPSAQTMNPIDMLGGANEDEYAHAIRTTIDHSQAGVLLPVLVPQGIAGQIIDVSMHSSKVLLIIDQISSVDGLVQRTRARGIVKGGSAGRCFFVYALRKHDIKADDVIVSSGLDDVFPKGLRIGRVSNVSRNNSGIFQKVMVKPYVDFEKLEEVLVLLSPS